MIPFLVSNPKIVIDWVLITFELKLSEIDQSGRVSKGFYLTALWSTWKSVQSLIISIDHWRLEFPWTWMVSLWLLYNFQRFNRRPFVSDLSMMKSWLYREAFQLIISFIIQPLKSSDNQKGILPSLLNYKLTFSWWSQAPKSESTVSTRFNQITTSFTFKRFILTSPIKIKAKPW